MAYNGIAWPGLTLSLKAVTAERNKIARWIKTGEDRPGCYIRHKQAMTKYRAWLADLDTGLQILRAAQKATERPTARKRRKLADKISVEPIAS